MTMLSQVCNEDCSNCKFSDCAWDEKIDRKNHYLRHAEEYKQRAKKWQTENRERINELSRIRYAKNIDKERERCKKYQREHREERKLYMREYRLRKKTEKGVI